MKTMLILIVVGLSTVAHAKEASLALSGTVPVAAEVVIKNGNQIVSKSSAGLKTRIQKRNLASIVEVTAP
jgi:hypothetical protein